MVISLRKKATMKMVIYSYCGNWDNQKIYGAVFKTASVQLCHSSSIYPNCESPGHTPY